MKNLKNFLLLLLMATFLSGCAFPNFGNKPISSFSECAAKYPVMESSPRQCRIPDGTVFAEQAPVEKKNTEPKAACQDKCGDGVCMKLACLSADCPCAETVSSCPADCKDDAGSSNTQATSSNGIANPASVNCENLGGKLEIKTDDKGAQTGICRLPSGQECEEWALFRNECGLSPDSRMGVLEGKVTIGPNCPVERIGQPCPTPPEAYTSREIIIYKEDGKTEVARQHFSTQGTYYFDLSPGVYIMNITTSGIGGSKDLPQTMIIKPGETLTRDFSIDTGIR